MRGTDDDVPGNGADAADLPVVAEVVRSGLVESRHRGSVVVLAPGGEVAWALGDVRTPMYPRSANKPMQAAGMVRCGLDVDGELLALVGGSHDGEDFHVEGVRRVLAAAGLHEAALRCPSSWPEHDDTRAALIRAGEEPSAIRMNCSGKHAGMLATCVRRGWSVDDYLRPDHPLQRALAATVAELAGEDVAHIGVDGCGAPLFALSLAGLARAFRAMALAASGTAERRVVDAVRAHPLWASGTCRDEAALVAAVPGLFAKSGAEACYAVALADGTAVACKVDDGSQRARPVVMAAVLRRLGLDVPVIHAQATEPLHGGGRPVGEVRAASVLTAGSMAG